MALIVQKYGGTSVGSIEKIRRVAERVVATHEQGNEVVVVVSAMAGETDRLLPLNLVFLKACQNEGGQRYQSAVEMHADLALREDRALIAMDELHRVLDGDDVERMGFVDEVDDGRERRGLS